jgi:hypothetical protein
MKATELLISQHREVSRLFKAIESASGAAEKRQLFEKLASSLVAHDGIERDIFYPACEEAMGMHELLGEALVEHGMIEFGVYQATEALGDDDFDYKCKVLGEMVEHHVEEEEKEFFPKVEKVLGDEQLSLLGEEMAEGFEDALAEDFRGPLYNNLQQVFMGALKTVPAKDPDDEKTEIKRSSRGASRRKGSKSA